jgi:C-terminal peptidase prc
MGVFLKPSRSIHASTTGIMLICLLLIFNASIQFDDVPPSINWSQPSSAPSRLEFELLNRVALRINQSYNDPTRIDPKAMFRKAMHYLELEIPEFVLTEPNDAHIETRLDIGTLSLSIDTDKLTSIWQTVFHISDTLRMLNRSEAVSPNLRIRLEQIACQGMLATLDAHSMVLSESALFELKQSTLGQFGGIGVVIASQNQELKIIEVMPGTPAHNANLKAGDRVLEIDKDTTENLSLKEAAELLRGPMGSTVNLTLKQSKSQQLRRVELKRTKIEVNSVTTKELKENIGYLRIDHFQEQTVVEVSQALQSWQSKINGLIVDLRQNPGGLLEQAISISNLFLSAGDIVTTVGYQKEPKQVHRATSDTLDEHTPIVILVDEHSASASEIMAAALQDNQRGLIFGRPTYGKGSVQVLFEFPSKWGLKITVAQYLTPSKASIQDVGVQPDVLVSGFAPGRIDVIEPTGAKAQTAIKASNVRFDYLQVKKDVDREIEFARLYLAAKSSQEQAGHGKTLKETIDQIKQPFSTELGRTFQNADLNWHPPNCAIETKIPLELNVETGASGVLTENWTPKVSVKNPSFTTVGALVLTIQSGGVSRRFNIGGLAAKTTVDVKPESAIKLVSQNGQCLVQVKVEDTCGYHQAEHDMVLNCSRTQTVNARSNLLLSDQTHGNGNGVLEFGEQGELKLRVLTNDKRLSGKVVASLAMLGQPRQRLIRLINGKSSQTVDPSFQDSKADQPLTFLFKVEAKRVDTLARSAPQKLLLQVKDPAGHHLIYKTIKLSLYPSEPIANFGQRKPQAHSTSKVTAKSKALIHFQPDVHSDVVGEVSGTLDIITRRGDWLLISIDGGLGWLNQSDRRDLGTQAVVTAPPTRQDLRYSRGGSINFERRPILTNHRTFVLKGAFSGFNLKDYRFFHNGKKKVYARIDERSVLGHPFETVIDLEPGMNRVDAILRSKSGFETSRTFFVTRRNNRR